MSDDTERIKEKVDLADLIGEYVQLKKAGNSYKGLCPFHQEKTPSFVVTPDKGIWYCFGCHVGGDAFNFIQQIEGVEFAEALKTLAERTGITLSSNQSFDQAQGKRAGQYELMELTARFYHEILVNQAAGKKAVQYLTERGVNQDSMETFMIGYAPQSWDTVQQYLFKKRYSLQQMMIVGLVGRSEHGKAYDRFRGRIMFPIRDVQGRVVAFGGRITPWHATGNEGKYVNSPETTIYQKRRVVYNLDRAKKKLHKEDPCLVVEGYLDVILLDQAGLKSTVASSGTAFTAEQVALLKRYTNRLHFAFDADAAGVKAAQAATQEAIRQGVQVATVVLPAGHDPAEIVQAGKESEVFSHQVPITTFLIERLSSTQSGDQNTVLQGVLPFVAMVTNPVQQGEMVRDIASTLGVPESSVISALEQTQPIETNEEKATDDVVGASSAITAEHILLALLVFHPSVRETFFSDLMAEMFSHAETQQLYAFLQQQAAEKHFVSLSPEQLLKSAPPELILVTQASGEMAISEVSASGQSPEQITQTLIQLLRKKALKIQLKALQQQLARGSTRDQAVILRQFQETAAELAAL